MKWEKQPEWRIKQRAMIRKRSLSPHCPFYTSLFLCAVTVAREKAKGGALGPGDEVAGNRLAKAGKRARPENDGGFSLDQGWVILS